MIDGSAKICIKEDDDTELTSSICTIFNYYKKNYLANIHEKDNYEWIDCSSIKNQKIKQWKGSFTDLLTIGRIFLNNYNNWYYLGSLDKGICITKNQLFLTYDKFYLPILEYDMPIKCPLIIKSMYEFDERTVLRLYNNSNREFGEPVIQKYVHPMSGYGYFIICKSRVYLANDFQVSTENRIKKEIL